MTYRILVNPGTPQAWEITLRPGVNRIGRDPDNDFSIAHPSLASHHCEVLVSDAGAFLKDLGSPNGTFVNRAPVGEIWLESGQDIQFGAVASVFEAAQPAATATPINQPAPGATIIVAAIGSPPATEPFSFPGASAEQREGELELSEQSPSRRPAESSAHPKTFPVHQAAEREAIRRKQFILGVAGAIMGSFIGLLMWFLFIKSTGSPLLVLAWGVGGLTGLGALLAAKKGALPLGIAAAICALVGIVSGESVAAKAIRAQEATKRSVAAYRSQLEFAKEALRADSPEELRNLLARVNEKRSEEITEDQIKTFQDQELPTLRNFALGKPSREEFTKEVESTFVDQFDYKEFLFKEDVKSGLFMVLFAVLGVTTAYKIGSGKGGNQPDDAKD
jgi:hypothetical protein